MKSVLKRPELQCRTSNVANNLLSNFILVLKLNQQTYICKIENYLSINQYSSELSAGKLNEPEREILS